MRTMADKYPEKKAAPAAVPVATTMRVKMTLQVGLDKPDVDGFTIYPKDSVAVLPIPMAQRLIKKGSAVLA
jgi:hypothetical protein